MCATSLYVVVPLFTTASITDFDIFFSPGFFLSSIESASGDDWKDSLAADLSDESGKN